jgi:hypothetical protein
MPAFRVILGLEGVERAGGSYAGIWVMA